MATKFKIHKNDFDEYEVPVYEDGVLNEKRTYFTDSLSDAQQTRVEMIQEDKALSSKLKKSTADIKHVLKVEVFDKVKDLNDQIEKLKKERDEAIYVHMSKTGQSWNDFNIEYGKWERGNR